MFSTYFVSGFKHVLPFGLDHVLFIVSLFFLSKNIREALLQAMLFTLAHSITLVAAVLGYIQFPSALAECLIAFSIFLIAVQCVVRYDINGGKWGVVFIFGLLHGLGFANALQENGLPANFMLEALFGFNLGVELAQCFVLIVCYFLIKKPLGKYPQYRSFVVIPLSLIIAAIGLFWSIDRFLSM